MATQSVVEMQKIINNTPFDTLWVFWESDMTFIENSSTFTDTFSETFYLSENASDTIFIRTHDQLLSGNTASLTSGGTTSLIPIGTYSVQDYKLIVEEAGYISYVQKVGTASTVTLSRYHETDVPSADTQVFEWACDDTVLRPFFNTAGNLVIGASYSSLTLRYPDLYPN